MRGSKLRTKKTTTKRSLALSRAASLPALPKQDDPVEALLNSVATTTRSGQSVSPVPQNSLSGRRNGRRASRGGGGGVEEESPTRRLLSADPLLQSRGGSAKVPRTLDPLASRPSSGVRIVGSIDAFLSPSHPRSSSISNDSSSSSSSSAFSSFSASLFKNGERKETSDEGETSLMHASRSLASLQHMSVMQAAAVPRRSSLGQPSMQKKGLYNASMTATTSAPTPAVPSFNYNHVSLLQKKTVQSNKISSSSSSSSSSSALSGGGRVGITMADLNMFLHTNPHASVTDSVMLAGMLREFCAVNAVPHNSPHLRSGGTDKVNYVTQLLFDRGVEANDTLLALAMQCLKILARKPTNRTRMGELVMKQLLKVLETRLAREDAQCVTECISVLFNLCHDKANADVLMEMHAVPLLLRCLQYEDAAKVQASAAGALHSLSFHLEGKRQLTMEYAEGIELAMHYFIHAVDYATQARCLGILHNCTEVATAIHSLREGGAIPYLVDVLRTDDLKLCTSAAGTIQNMAREAQCRALLNDTPDCISMLVELLFVEDVACQTKSAAALLNVVGPALSVASPARMSALRDVISNCLVMGMVRTAMYPPHMLQYEQETLTAMSTPSIQLASGQLLEDEVD